MSNSDSKKMRFSEIGVRVSFEKEQELIFSFDNYRFHGVLFRPIDTKADIAQQLRKLADMIYNDPNLS